MCCERIKRGSKKPLLVLPTGGGKTAIASDLVKRSYVKNKSSIFICHRQELVNQTYKTYLKNGLNPSIIQGGFAPNYDNPLQIASINTLIRRLDKVKYPDVIFFDEAQHLMSNTWLQVSKRFDKAVQVGLSATPSRLDGKPLSVVFDTMVETINTRRLIELGYLSPYRYYAPSIIDESELKMGSNGDYTQNSLAQASFTSRIIGDNIEQYKKLALGKRNIVFAVNLNHARDIVSRYNSVGIKAEMLDGEMSKKKREDIVNRFSNNEISVLVNVDIVSEGFDLPAVEVVSLLRPTASTSLYLQQVGRGLRIYEGKEHAIILDHVNNYKRHGMPDDIREWSLEGGLKKRRQSSSSSIAIKRCPICFFAHSPALKCPNCGHIYEADGKQIKEIAGELVLVNSEEYRQAQKKEVKITSSLKELVDIELNRGYKKFWAEKQWQIKTGVNLWANYEGLKEIAKARGYNSGWIWVQWNKRRG